MTEMSSGLQTGYGCVVGQCGSSIGCGEDGTEDAWTISFDQGTIHP